MYFVGVGKVQLIIILLRLIFTTYLVPEGSGNRNCQNRLRKPVFSSVDQLDNQKSHNTAQFFGGRRGMGEVGRLLRLRKGFCLMEALPPWEGPLGCVAFSFLHRPRQSFADRVRDLLSSPEESCREVLTTYTCLHTVRALPASFFATWASWRITKCRERQEPWMPQAYLSWRSSMNQSGLSQRGRVPLCVTG